MAQIGAPALYANIPIINIKNDMKAEKVKEFEGVNFTKKLEEVKIEEEKQEKVEETINEMIDGDTKEKSKKETKSKTKSKPKTKKKEKVEAVDEEKEDDEDDDDVTFDDLLKAAEAEDEKKVNEG